MSLNRRNFIGIGSLFACGTALFPTALFATAPRALRGGLPLRSADQTVLDFVRGYSSNLRIIGVSVLGRLRTAPLRKLHLLAEISTPEAVQAAFATIRFSDAYAAGNTLSFTVGDVDAVVEHLLPEAFAARLASLTKRANNAFAHDALSYDPATNLLTDPFSARSGALRLINRTFGNEAALDVVLRGVFEAGQINLPPSAEFQAWKARILRQISKSNQAPKLVEKLLQHLTPLADKLSREAFQALLRTRLVSTALFEVFGVVVADVIAKFQEQRLVVEASIADSALWLALLLSPELQSNADDGAALTWVRGGDPFQVSQSRRAVRVAENIVKNYPSITN